MQEYEVHMQNANNATVAKPETKDQRPTLQPLQPLLRLKGCLSARQHKTACPQAQCVTGLAPLKLLRSPKASMAALMSPPESSR
jgi:hypothetical protein